MTNRFSILALWFVSCQLLGDKLLVDRMLLKINDTAFTQRDAETYLLLKAILQEDRTLIPSAQSWTKGLREFKNDMLLYEESQKLRHISPFTESQLNQLMGQIQKQSKEGPAGELAKRLALSEGDWKDALQIFLKVEKAKNTEHSPAEKRQTSGGNQKFSELEKKNYVRFFEDAESYKVIHPSQFRFSAP